MKEKESKPDKVLVSKLQSGRSSSVREALREIKVTGTVPIIPYLFDIVTEGKDNAIIDEILKILSDIKDKEAAPVMVECINNRDFGSRTADVLSVCWQSRLDFSPFIDDFTKIFLRSDYQSSIEAFTVIEDSIFNAPVAKRHESLKILENGIKEVGDDKKPLYFELLKVIKASLNFTIEN